MEATSPKVHSPTPSSQWSPVSSSSDFDGRTYWLAHATDRAGVGGRVASLSGSWTVGSTVAQGEQMLW